MSTSNPKQTACQLDLPLDAAQCVAVATTFRFANVIARAAEIWLLDNLVECTINAAGPGNEMPTMHDRDHAAVVSFVVSSQQQYSNLGCKTALLAYRDGTRRRIRINLKRAAAMCRRAGQTPIQERSPIPAPLVGLFFVKRW